MATEDLTPAAEQEGDPEEGLKKFQQEITEYKARLESEGELPADLSVVNAEELTAEDMDMWRRIRSDWKEAYPDYNHYRWEMGRTGNNSRSQFAAHMGNVIMTMQSEEYFRKKAEKEQKREGEN